MKKKLFYSGCVPARVAIATVLIFGINPMVSGVSIFGCIALLMSLGFFINHCRHKKVGIFGGEVWWHDFRPFHAGIWLIVGILLFFDVQYAGILVLYDLIPGIIESCRNTN